ncbi:unnamed protein product [Amoebophrya sp. A25]|nr:unnamed protein product [Amoebophrya sp. A25]|eukprot:GSA25T00025285001.1
MTGLGANLIHASDRVELDFPMLLFANSEEKLRQIRCDVLIQDVVLDTDCTEQTPRSGDLEENKVFVKPQRKDQEVDNNRNHYHDDKVDEEGTRPNGTTTLAFLVHNLLSREECVFLKEKMDADSDEDGVVREKIDDATRQSDRKLYFSNRLASVLFERLEPFLAKMALEEIHVSSKIAKTSFDDDQGKLRSSSCTMTTTAKKTIFRQEHEETSNVKDTAASNKSRTTEDAQVDRASAVTLPEKERAFVHLEGRRWHGRWTATGLNDRFSFLLYKEAGQAFLPHSDGSFGSKDPDTHQMRYSMFTVLLYLNDDFTGGETNLLSHYGDDGETEIHFLCGGYEENTSLIPGKQSGKVRCRIFASIKPGAAEMQLENQDDPLVEEDSFPLFSCCSSGRPDKEMIRAAEKAMPRSSSPHPLIPNTKIGAALVFFQNGMLHEGAPLQGGSKYVIRTDVMYHREQEVPLGKHEESQDDRGGLNIKNCTNYAKEEKLRLADQYLEKAIAFEEQRKFREAQEHYRWAFHLNPELERLV